MEPLPEPEPTDLLGATIRLTHRVEALTKNVTIAAQQNEILRKQTVRTRWLTWTVALILMVGGAFGYRLYDTLTDNAIQSCENANQSRTATLSLWTFILEVSAQNPDQTPAERQLLVDLGEWIGVLYAQRDCTDLSREYPIPPPPTLSHD